MLSLKLILFLFYLVSVFGVDLAAAAVYKYTDSGGRLHYSNVPVLSKYRYYQAEPGEVARKRPSIANLIKHYARKHRLDPYLIRAVVRVESDFDSGAVSPCGAIGLMQLHPETIKDLNVVDPFDPSANIAGGTKYLRRMLNLFDGDLDLALAAYNAGPSTVKRYNGIPPYPETRSYVNKVKYYQQLYRQGGS
ncbi:MAG: transglycosylase SLT domain-containing protein [Thermodesulfobacteriota bacterium]|nr:transglycosylase SLT domain-containing protein [Thermodesulfobacteriota bacterium]